MKWGLLIVCLLLSVRIYGQADESRVTLELHGERLDKALQEIERQTGLSFSYESYLLSGCKPVSGNWRRKPLPEVLNALLEPNRIAWVRMGESIILKRRLSIVLEKDSLLTQQLQEVLVEADSTRHAGTGEPDVQSLSASRIQQMPAMFGQADVVRGLQQLPGVASGTEGISGLYVRGGNNDENLFLLDDMTLYQVSHVGGLFSPFNPDVIRRVDFYKSGFPSRYGGRLSSVVDIMTREGNPREFHGAAMLGLISGSFYLEGPIVKDKLTFHFGLRRSWLDVLTEPGFAITRRVLWKKEKDLNMLSFRYAFHDMNARVDYRIDPSNKLSLHLYSGKDLFKYRQDRSDTSIGWDGIGLNEYYGYNLDWGNFSSALRWETRFSPVLKMDAAVYYTRYYSNLESEQDNKYMHYEDYYPSWGYGYGYGGGGYWLSGSGNNSYWLDLGNGSYEEVIHTYPPSIDLVDEKKTLYNHSLIQDYGARFRFLLAPWSGHRLRFGAGYTFHDYRPVRYAQSTETFFRGQWTEEIKPIRQTLSRGSEWQVYLEDEMRLGERIRANAGLHLSVFSSGRTYWNLQPRLALNYRFSDRWTGKLSYARMCQYVHMVPSSYFALPNDVWFPTNRFTKPMLSDQFAAGAYYRLNPSYHFSAEVYFKKMHNLLEFRNGAMQFEGYEDWDERMAVGSGRSYGVEWAAHKDLGKVTGWLAYTLSWSDRLFPELNDGQRFPSRYDNRHKLNIVASWRISKKVELNAAWVYNTGNRVTLPLYVYSGNGQNPDWEMNRPVFLWGERNQVRLPAYHRLDLGLNIYRPKKKGRMGIWNISLYNAYCHMNAFTIRTSYNKETGEAKASTLSLLPVIPTVSYTYKF